VQSVQERRLRPLLFEESLQLSSLAVTSLLDPKDDGAGRGGYKQCSAECERTGRAFQALQLKEGLRDSIVTEKLNMCWEDVAGLESAKEELHEAVIFPTRFPHMHQGKRKACRAILLHGPPPEQASRTRRRRWQPSATTRCSALAAAT